MDKREAIEDGIYIAGVLRLMARLLAGTPQAGELAEAEGRLGEILAWIETVEEVDDG